MHPAHSYTLYGNIQYHEDPEIFAQQLLFDSDRELLDQFKVNEGIKLSIDPLGSALDPFMALPYEGPLYSQNYFTDDFIEPEIQMDSAEKNLLMDTQDERELRDRVVPMTSGMMDLDLNKRATVSESQKDASPLVPNAFMEWLQNQFYN